ncbi:MAG TPA: ATP-binding cassette domain-containing protein [Halothiobacillaceae bacterium]|nr:ATP-binding cassette domain-containing protein [Halothiobacillaceae bacterium]
MPLLTLDNLQFSIGPRTILDHVGLTIEKGEKYAIIGRNGAGKSTLLKIIAGLIRPDDGQVRLAPGATVAYLQQDPQADYDQSVYHVVASGLGDVQALLTQYHDLISDPEKPGAMDALAELQHQLEAQDGWSAGQRVDEVITRLNLNPDAIVSHLSGGERRRVLLGRALVQQPDLLLLDEPTNHLDIAGIEWLEELVRSFSGAVLFITHDRAFLKALAGGIIEIDRGHLTTWPGDYDNYLRRLAERENAEAQENARFDKTLAQEEIWIRQGIKARRTRNEGRVRNLEKMRAERAARREKAGSINLSVQAGQSSGKIIAEFEQVSLQFENKPIVRDLTTTIMRGDRIGLVGPNGVGKSTLIKLILGELEPDSGSIKRGSRQNVAYFDQHRAQLNPQWTALENLCDGGDRLEVGGRNVHGLGYLQQFLFTPERARSKTESLSGGERNRLLLAKLFAQPANLLVLDEPTNDLDLETLEVLEQALSDFDGTLLLVSHDRAFLDNVVTSLLVFEGQGRIVDVPGGYQDYLREKRSRNRSENARATAKSTPKKTAKKTPPSKKLSYKLQQELESIPIKIEQLEAEQLTLSETISQPDFYQQPAEQIQASLARASEIEDELNQLLERWAELESSFTDH